jgi:hypothetical protein
VVELAVAFSLLALFTGGLVRYMSGVVDSQRVMTAQLTLESTARNGLQRIRSLLRGATFASLEPKLTRPWYSERIDFQRDEDGDGMLEPLERVEWRLDPGELDDGQDNDGDGLVDEGRVLWIASLGLADERTLVLVPSVARYHAGEVPNNLDEDGNGLVDETGLCFDFTDQVLRLHLSVETAHEGVRLEEDLATLLYVRN